MNPNKKAEELIEKFGDLAVDVVDEILRLPSIEDGRMIVVLEYDYEYWQQVKQLIINKK